MNDTKKLSVIKIPNENIEENVEIEKFPRMPRMYLELLENKEKVKPDLVNRDYDPDGAESVISFYSSKNNNQKSSFEEPLSKIEDDSLEDADSVSEKDDEEGSISENDSVDNNSLDDDNESFEKKSIDHSSIENDEDDEDELSFQDDSNNDNEFKFETNSELKFDETSQKDDDSLSKNSFQSEKNGTRDKLKQMLQAEVRRPSPPRLSDLEKTGMLKTNRTIPTLDHLEVNEDEDEEDKKRELLFKFELLKKSYKNVNIPEFSVHSSLKKMNETYENQLRHLTLDSSVESYKNILVGGFMIFEFIFGVWLKFDMSGFTQQQILNMNQYERLLIELGQKSYVPEGQQWPVEFRLIGMIILNAVIFIVSKMILKKTGSNLMGMMNHVQTSTPTKATPQEPKKKMKGPSINLDDL